MDVEASISESAGKDAYDALVQTVTSRLYRFEQRLQRVQVWAERCGAEHLCCLQAWSERGQTLAVERRATSLGVALNEALGALTRALEHGRTSESITRPYASRVLLVLHELDATTPNVLWARSLASALAGGLDVCRWLRDAPSSAEVGSGPEWLRATRNGLATRRETRAWCSTALPEGVLCERIIAGAGDWVNELSALARRQGSDWLVLPADVASGAATLALARSAGCPVLVARAPTTRSTLLVSAQPEEDEAATLNGAAELSEALNAPVLAFRNVFGRPAGERFAPEIEALAARWNLIQHERHPLEAGRRIPALDVVLGCTSDHVAALLSQAVREDAEMIVIGAGQAAPAGDDSLPAAVVERAVRSVVVVPPRSAVEERATRRAPRSGIVPAAEQLHAGAQSTPAAAGEKGRR